MKMNRRDVLKTAGLVLGYTLTAGTAAAVLGGCSADASPDFMPTVLSNEQVKTLSSIADAIVPGTETLPGAKDVNIGKFMDERLSMYSTEAEQEEFKSGYDAFVANHKVKGMSHDDILSAVRSELDADSVFMKNVYELSVAGFCTSERGMKEVLIFKPIPGEQNGDVTTEEVGGIWAI
jgi:hypothetical protein